MWQTQTPRGTPPKAQLPVPGIVKRAYIALARLPPNPSTLPKENITTEYSSGVVEPVYSSPDPLPSYPPVSHYTTTMAKGPEKDPPNRTLTTRSSDLSLGQNARLSTHSAANIATESLIESLSATPPLSHDSSMSICTQPRTSPRPSQHAVEHPTGDGTNHYQVNRASNSSRAWMRAARRRHRNAHRWRQLYSAARGAAENRAARRGSQSVQNLALTSTGLPTPDEILAVLPAEGILIKDFIAAFKGREKRNERAFVKAVQAVSTYDKKNKLLFPSGLSSNTRKTYLAATTAEAH